MAQGIARRGIIVSTNGGHVERDLSWLDFGYLRDNGQLYVSSPDKDLRSAIHVDKLNPHTGQRTGWRDLRVPPIGGIYPD